MAPDGGLKSPALARNVQRSCLPDYGSQAGSLLLPIFTGAHAARAQSGNALFVRFSETDEAIRAFWA